MEKGNNAGFAKVKVQSPENSSTDCNYRGRNQFLKMYYPNGVLIILPTNIDPVLLGRYIHAGDNA